MTFQDVPGLNDVPSARSMSHPLHVSRQGGSWCRTVGRIWNQMTEYGASHEK